MSEITEKYSRFTSSPGSFFETGSTKKKHKHLSNTYMTVLYSFFLILLFITISSGIVLYDVTSGNDKNGNAIKDKQGLHILSSITIILPLMALLMTIKALYDKMGYDLFKLDLYESYPRL